MAINKLVNIKVPILEALGDMGFDHSKNVPDLIRWAVRAEREIGSYYALRKEIKVLEIDHHRAELPCEAMYVQTILLGDHGSQCHTLFDCMCMCSSYATFLNNDTFIVGSFLNGTYPDFLRGPCSWDIQDNHIVFGKHMHGEKITVRYLGQCVDEDGFPMVVEGHLDAIIAFIMLKVATRSRFSPNKMDLGDVINFKKDWGKLAAEARADDAALTDDDKRIMSSIYNDPLSGGYGCPI